LGRAGNWSMEQDVPWAQVFAILRRRRRFIVGCGVVGLALAAIVALQTPPRYTAKAQVIVEGDHLTTAAGQVVAHDPAADEAAILTEVIAMSSPDLIDRVLRKLADDPDFRAIRDTEPPKPSPGAGAETSTASLIRTVRQPIDIASAWLGRTLRTLVPQERNSAPASPGAADRAGAGLTQRDVSRQLKVFQEQGSRAVAVTFTSTNPREAAAVVNALVSQYLASQAEHERADYEAAITQTARKILDLKAEIAELDAAIAKYQAANGFSDATRTNVADQKLDELNRQLSEALADLAVRQARYDNLMSLQHGSSGWGRLVGSLNTQGLVDLHAQLLAISQSRSDSISLPEQIASPDMPDSGANAGLRQRLQTELDEAAAKLANEAAVAESRVNVIKQQLAAAENGSNDTTLHQLTVTAASARIRFDRLNQKREELIEQHEAFRPNVHLLSSAAIPDRPSSINPLFLLPPALVASLLIGGLTAIARDRLNQTFRDEADVAAGLGLPCVAVVPRLSRSRGRRARQHPLGRANGIYAEAMRSVIASLLPSQLRRRSSRVILVTSSIPGEGKTTFATSLAAYAAASGCRTLLLDLDLRHAAVSKQLGNSSGNGLLDVLEGDRPVGTEIVTVAGLDLDYLPLQPGAISDGLPLFLSGKMPLLLERLRATYSYIFIDSAPVLAIAETTLLATMVDKVILVVRWAKTRRSEGQHAVAQLQTAVPARRFAEMTSAVLTQVDLKRYARARSGDRGEVLSRYSSYYATN
jgi:polysaccharide biosynthesis transport protein